MLRHLLAILALPVVVTVLVPALLLRGSTGFGSTIGVVVGVASISIGFGLVAGTIQSFAIRGGGTLAPWDPPRRLVISGIYRHVRNPMITGVFLILVGESLLFGSVHVAVWAASFAVINAVYIPLVEEQGLIRRFGSEYERYRRNVPRWVPRRSGWPGERAAVPED